MTTPMENEMIAKAVDKIDSEAAKAAEFLQ